MRFLINLYGVDSLVIGMVEHEAPCLPYTVYQMKDGKPRIFNRVPGGLVHDDGSVGFVEAVATEIGDEKR